MVPAAYSHGISVTARCRRLVSIQGALQVGLDGSVNAENVGEGQVAGCGGQPDFSEAVMATSDGIGIIALPATASRGTASRIVRGVDGGVTTPRYWTDRVVTELGIAELRGRSLSARAEALRAIAHPAFREALD
jgi:acyl-CoA hydrolase